MLNCTAKHQSFVSETTLYNVEWCMFYWITTGTCKQPVVEMRFTALSARYAGAWLDSDWCTRHATCTVLIIGQEACAASVLQSRYSSVPNCSNEMCHAVLDSLHLLIDISNMWTEMNSFFIVTISLSCNISRPYWQKLVRIIDVSCDS